MFEAVPQVLPALAVDVDDPGSGRLPAPGGEPGPPTVSSILDLTDQVNLRTDRPRPVAGSRNSSRKRSALESNQLASWRTCQPHWATTYLAAAAFGPGHRRDQKEGESESGITASAVNRFRNAIWGAPRSGSYARLSRRPGKLAPFAWRSSARDVASARIGACPSRPKSR